MKAKTKGMSSKDSATFMIEKGRAMNESVIAYENNFLLQHKGSYISEVIGQKMEKEAKEIPKA